ncbi:MAG TPA: YceI family protein [Phaeodactylibacter sp.]|nr:YceI family protein [Phaeodactylibacter sp.]
MKKTILMVFALAIMLSACSDNGKQAETKAAEKVEVVKNTGTAAFKKIKSGSHVKWRASHLAGTQKRFGKVFLKNAEFLVNNGKLTNATVVIDIPTLTVESFNEGAAEKGDLTGHLKSADFFNVAKYPTAKFELTKIEPATGEYNSKVTGNLTILDATKSITFNANVKLTPNEVSVKSEDFAVNRTDWGLSYHTEGTAGVPVNYLIANDIGFTIDVTLTK